MQSIACHDHQPPHTHKHTHTHTQEGGVVSVPAWPRFRLRYEGMWSLHPAKVFISKSQTPYRFQGCCSAVDLLPPLWREDKRGFPSRTQVSHYVISISFAGFTVFWSLFFEVHAVGSIRFCLFTSCLTALLTLRLNELNKSWNGGEIMSFETWSIMIVQKSDTYWWQLSWKAHFEIWCLHRQAC